MSKYKDSNFLNICGLVSIVIGAALFVTSIVLAVSQPELTQTQLFLKYWYLSIGAAGFSILGIALWARDAMK